MRFSKKQLILAIVAFVLLAGSASAATVTSISNKRAKEEQSRVLRTSNLEEAVKENTVDGETKPEDSKPTDSTNKPNISTPSTKPTTKTVNFVKGGGSLQDTTVVISLTADSTLNGTCTYMFSLGNSSFSKSNTATNTQTCAINIPLSAFVKSGNWYFKLSYVSSDGNTKGTGGGFEIAIMPEVREISFKKGGAGQSETVVNASSDMSETQSGTCTFKFSLGGVVKVSKTTTISGTNRCSTEIPVSEFPQNGTYQYSLSFISNDTLTIANQSPFDVDVTK